MGIKGRQLLYGCDVKHGQQQGLEVCCGRLTVPISELHDVGYLLWGRSLPQHAGQRGRVHVPVAVDVTRFDVTTHPSVDATGGPKVSSL